MGMFDQDGYGNNSTKTDCKTEVNDADVLERIQEHALDVVLLQQRFKAAKDALQEATEGLAMSLPSTMREVGEHNIMTSKLSVQTSVAEKMTWDQEVMADLYGDLDDVPECLSIKFSVTKARYDKASQPVRDYLENALTRSASKPKFKIEAI